MPGPQDHAEPEIRLVKSVKLRYLLLFIGIVCVIVGVVALFIPFLPTTPFLLIAAACFARASERCYRLLLSNRYCGPVIRQWRATKTIPKKAKLTAIAMLVFGFGCSITFFVPGFYPRLAAALVMLALAALLSSLPTSS